jgi:hypothetical protein
MRLDTPFLNIVEKEVLLNQAFLTLADFDCPV